MPTSDQINPRLQHAALELHQAQQKHAAVSNHLQTVFDEIQACNGHAELIGPAIDTLYRQPYTLTEGDLQLRQENVQLKADLEAVQQALRRKTEEQQAQLAISFKPNERSAQRIQTFDQSSEFLISKVTKTIEKYESAIIELADQKVPIETLQNNQGKHHDWSRPFTINCQRPQAFNVTADTMTTESSPDSSLEKVSLNHGWISQFPSGAAVHFPDIAPQPQSASLTPAHRVPIQVTIRKPDIPKGRAIVRGTREANESFERMKRTLNAPPPANSTNISNCDNKATAASSSSASGLAMPIITPLGVQPVTPTKVKSKLNPAVEAFTPSNSSSKESAKTNSVQACSPCTSEPKTSTTATITKEEGFIPSHLRGPSKVSIKEETVTAIEGLSVKDKAKDHGTVAMSIQKEPAKETEPNQATSLTPHILPHLRRPTKSINNEGVHPSQVQRSGHLKNIEDSNEGHGISSSASALTGMKENVKGVTTPGAFVKSDPGLEAWLDSQEKAKPNDAPPHKSAPSNEGTLIQISPDNSPKVSRHKTVPLPPGFIPISTLRTAGKTKTAAPTKTDQAASPIGAHPGVTYGSPTDKDEDAASWQDVSIKTTSENDNNAAFVADYNKKLRSVGEKYGKHSRKSSDVEEGSTSPIEPKGADPVNLPHQKDSVQGHTLRNTQTHPPPQRTSIHELGALLDAECYNMVVKPRRGVKVEAIGLEWKAVRKDGKVFYVL